MSKTTSSLLVLATAFLSLILAQECFEYTVLVIEYDFKSSACRRAMFDSRIECTDCQEDFANIITTLAASDNPECQRIATEARVDCAYDGYNQRDCSEVVDNNQYFSCVDGFFSCCVGLQGEILAASAAEADKAGILQEHDYTFLCSENSGFVIPDYGECSTDDISTGTVVSLTEYNGEIAELDCEGAESIVSKYAGSACSPLSSEQSAQTNWTVVCSEECAIELASIYKDFVALNSYGCNYQALQILQGCQFDTASNMYCTELSSSSSSSCEYSASCCGVSDSIAYGKFADSVPNPDAIYFRTTFLTFDAEISCAAGTTIAPASQCNAAAISSLVQSASTTASLSLWVASAMVLLLAIHIA